MDLEKSKLSLKSSDLDLKNDHNVVAVIEWHNEAGEVVEGTLPETTKLKVNGVDTTYTTEEKGNTSELTFTCDSVGTHEITVDGLGEGVPGLGPVTLTVVDTTPVVDLEKTVVSINPETYDVEDRDNSVLKFEWKDQFGNPITNTLPEDVKISMNGSDIVPNAKENGDNTEVTIKSTVANTYEIVVTGLKTSEVKFSFTVTDVRSRVVDPTKTTFTLTSTEHWLKDGKVTIKFKATVKNVYNKPVPINLKHFTIKSNGILVPSSNGAKGTGNVNLTIEVTEVGEHTYELFYKDVKHASDIVVNVTHEPVVSKTKVTLEKTSVDLKVSDDNSLLLEWFDSDSNPAVNTLPGGVSFTIDGTPVETTTTENGISTKVSFKVPSTVGKNSITIKGLGDSDFGPYEFDIVDTTPVFDASKSTWGVVETSNGEFEGVLDAKDQFGDTFSVDSETVKLSVNGEEVEFSKTPSSASLTTFYFRYETPGTHVVSLDVLGTKLTPDKEITVLDLSPKVSIKDTKATISTNQLDLATSDMVAVILSWIDDEGNPIEHSAPDTLKVTLNGVEVETVVNTEPGLTSELMFEVNVAGSYQVNVIGLEGVSFTDLSLTVVDTTPVVDLEKTMVSIDPETYDIEDRDNTVVRFDWKDQFGNPITNTLPESVKLTLNDSTITVNPKENGNNTEVVIKSTVVKSHEIVVTGLNSKDTKLTFSVTDRRLGKVAQSKTSVGYSPEVVNLYENNKVVAQFFMKDYKDNELTLPITVKAFIDGVEAEVVDIEMDDKIRTYQITVNPVTEEKDQVLSLEISYDEDGETKSFKTNSKSIKVIPRPEGIVVEPYLTGFGKYYRDVDTHINGWIKTKDGDDNKLPTEAGIWKYYANDVEITKVVETPPTGVTKDLSFKINFADNLDVIKDGLVNFKITNLDDEVIFTEKVSIYPLKSMEMDNLTSRSYLMGDRYTILENGEAHCHFLLEPRNKEGELVPYYDDDIAVMDFNSISVIPHGDITVDGDGKFIVPLTFTEPVDLQLVIAINGGTVSNGTVMDAEFRGEGITILTQEGYDELLKEVDNSRTAIEVITKEHPLINGQARVELEVTVKNIEDRDVDVNVDHFKVYEGETLIDSINTSTSTGKLTMTFYSSELGDHTYTVKYNDVKSGNEVTVDVIEATVDISLTQVSLVKEVVDIKDDSNNTLLIKWFLDELTPIENTLPEGVTFTINDEVLEVNVTEQGTSSKVDFIVPDSPGNYDLMVNGLDGEGVPALGPYSFEVVDTTPVFDLNKSSWRLNSIGNGEFECSIFIVDQYGDSFPFKEEDVKLLINDVESPHTVVILSTGLGNLNFNYSTPGNHTVKLNVLGANIEPVENIEVLDLTPVVSIGDTTASISTEQLDLATSDKVTITLDWVDQFGNPIEHNAPDDVLIKLNGVVVTPVKDESGLTNTKYELTIDTPDTYSINVSGLVDPETNEEVTYNDFTLVVTDTSLVFDPNTSTWELIDDSEGNGEKLTCIITCKDRNGDSVITPSNLFVVLVDDIEVEVLPKQESGSIVELSFDYSTPGAHTVSILVDGEILGSNREFTTIDRSPKLNADNTTWSISPTKININETDTFKVTINPKDQYGDEFTIVDGVVLLSIGDDVIEPVALSGDNNTLTYEFKKTDLGTFEVDLNLQGLDILPNVSIEIVDIIDGSEIEPSFDINKSSWKLTKAKANISGEMTIALTVDSRNKEGGKTAQPWSLYYQIEDGALVQLDSKDKPNGTEYVIDVSDYPELGFYSITLFVLSEKFGESQEFEVVNINDGGEVEEPGEGCDCENRDRPYGGNPIDELLEERFESIICCRDSYPDKMEL